MFREEVRRVDFSLDLAEFYGGIFDTLLCPEGTCVDVTKFASARTATDADGCCRVGPYPEVDFPAKVLQKCLISEANAGRFHDSVKLSLSATEADGALRGAPRLDEVRPDHEAPSIRRFTGFGIPRPMRIAVCDHFPCGLPRVLEDEAWTTF